MKNTSRWTVKEFLEKVVDVWHWAVYWGMDPGCLLLILIGLIGVILVLLLTHNPERPWM